MNEAEFESFDWRSFRENTTELIAEDWILLTPGAWARTGTRRDATR